MFKLYPAACLALVLLPAATVLAQPSPDAGSLLREIEKAPSRAVPPADGLPAVPAAPAAHAPSAVKVNVSAFRFEGNRLLGDEALARSLAGLQGRALDFAGLQSAADAVAKAYRDAGWIVRADLPPQDIRDGIVTIRVVEATMGAVNIEGAAPRHAAVEQLLGIVEAAQPKGAPLSAQALDRAVLLLNDVPGVHASASLAAGALDKETDLVLRFTPQPLARGEVAVDNAGSRATGTARLGGAVWLDGALGMGDQASVRLLHAEGSDYARLGFSLPLGSHGWRLGANVSHFDYRLVAPEFGALHARGSSSTAGIEAAYPLIRARTRNLFASIGWDHRRLRNESAGATTSAYRLDTLTAALQGNLFDRLGGASNGRLAVVSGHLDLGGSPHQGADALGTRAAGRFTVIRYFAGREQVLGDRLTLYGGLTGQFADKNLDSAEKFYLGGVGGVRAYPSGEGSGADGQLLNLELRARLRDDLTLAGFYDWGRVRVNRHNDFAGAATINRYALQGAGAALDWRAGAGISIKAIWARRIGHNPNPTPTGADQDGSLVKNRFWLAVGLAF